MEMRKGCAMSGMRVIHFVIFIGIWVSPGFSSVYKTSQNRVIETAFVSSIFYDAPFHAVELDVEIEGDDGKKTLYPAYWAGGRVWRFRFSSAKAGTYSFTTRCSDASNAGLHNRSGTIVVQPYTGQNPLYRHGPLTINREGKYIQHADGTPFFWLADSWWHGMTKRFRWPDDFRVLTRDRKEKGFSVIQFAAGFPCDIYEFDPRGANRAGFPMTQNYETINPAYFDLVDLRVAYLAEQGLVPNILGTWGYYLPFMGVETMKAYWRYLIARYGAYPVTWTVAGETTLIWYLTEDGKRDERRQLQREGWAEIAAFIKKTDPYDRLITAHPGPASGSFEPITDMALLDIVMVQPGHNGWRTIPSALNHLGKAMALYPDRPVMQGEVCFEGMHGGGSGPKVQRILFWTNVLSGAAGHCYGVDGIWQFNTKKELFGKSPAGHIWGNAPWEEAHRWKGSTYVGLGKQILERYSWWRFTVHPEWIEPAADAGEPFKAYAAGIPGEMRVFYFPEGVLPWGQKYTVKHLNKGKTYAAIYIDPRTGDEYPINEMIENAAEWVVPQAPILQDWVLVLKGKSS
ncbi:DUF4038 domain-containing protein [bacterium]|nr:DUF4038 domain-containing protein [bacterium]